MDEILMMILKIVVIICMILLTRYVIPAVKTWCDAHMSKELRAAVKECVEAAEQTFTGEKQGEDKYSQVMKDLLLRYYPDCKMEDIDDAYLIKINRMIESAVFQMNREKDKTQGMTAILTEQISEEEPCEGVRSWGVVNGGE